MKVEEIIKQSGIEPYKTSGSCEGVFYLNQVIEIAELYATHPTTTETLQEGDWTKCEKFSEWVALFEIEGCGSYFENKYDQYNGEIECNNSISLMWGKGENFLPYQEFKQRSENTFKTK